jgi:hypothetical protein
MMQEEWEVEMPAPATAENGEIGLFTTASVVAVAITVRWESTQCHLATNVDRHLQHQQQQQQQQGDVMGMVHLAGDWSNNSTSDDDPYSNVPYLRQLVLASFLATFVIGLLGNSLVIFVVCSFADVRRKSVANYYILSLAIADWCFVLFLPLYAVATFTHSWQFGTVLCKLATGVREANRYASIFTLVALSVDR